MKNLKRKAYEKLLEPLQLELVGMSRWLQHSGKRIVVVIEGRDTAGKGGVINAISEHLNPRQCHVVALSKPSERENTQWYFQRYVPHLPAAGEILLLDRSWYNRAGVEKVMGFCNDGQYRAFLKQAPVPAEECRMCSPHLLSAPEPEPWLPGHGMQKGRLRAE